MKRKIALWLAAALLLSAASTLSSCDKGEGNETISESESTSESTSTSESESTSESTSASASDSESESETDPEPSEPVNLALEFSKNRELFSAKDGSVIKSSGFASTDYMDITDYYALSYVLGTHKMAMSVVFFDADKNFISGVGQGEGNDLRVYLTTQGHVVIPEGAVYARFTNIVNTQQPMTDAAVIAYPTEAVYQAYLDAHPLANLKITCLGDSLTEGDYGLVVGQANVFYQNYPFYLSMQTGATTANYGCCGATSTSYLSQWVPQVNVADSDVVILMLGSNLGLEGSYANSYKSIVEKVQAKMKDGAILVLVTPPHATEIVGKPNYGYNDNVLSAVEFVRAYAAETGLPLIDAYADSPIQEENEDIYQKNDGLHMCREGYEAFAAFMVEELEKILIEQPVID